MGETASAANTAGNVAGNAGSAMEAFNAGSSAMSSGGYLDSALSAAGGGETAASLQGAGTAGGFGIEPMTSYPSTGPVDMGGPSMTAGQEAALDRWGTADPSWWQKGYDYYDQFSEGMNQDLPQAYKNFGNNPETYGYGFSKLSGLARMGGGGGGGSTPSMSTTVNYQQPQDEYRRKYRRY